MICARRRASLHVSRQRAVASGALRHMATWCVLVLIGVVLGPGCRSPRSVPSSTVDGHRPAGSSAVPSQTTPPSSSGSSLGLEPGHFYTAPEYAEAGKQLAAALRRALPDRHFSLDWTPERLHICVQDVPYDVLVAPRGGGRPSMLLQIALLAPANSEPTTKEFWISAKRANGQLVQERDTWDGWARLDEHRRLLLAGKEHEEEEPPHGLPRNLVSGDRDHAAAAQALFEALTRQYPGVEFSVAWTTERLDVTIQNVTFEKSLQVLYPNKPDPRRRAVFGGVLVEAATASAPPARELRLWARRERDRGWCGEVWAWELLMHAYGPQTRSGRSPAGSRSGPG